MFFLNQGNIPKLSLPEDTNIMLLEVGLTVPEEKSVQEKTKSFKVFSKRMTINWVAGRGREGSCEHYYVNRLKFIWRGREWCFFLFLSIRNVTSTGPFTTQGSKNHRMKQSTTNVILVSY